MSEVKIADGQVYNRYTGLLLGILGILCGISTIVLDSFDLSIPKYITLGFSIYCLILGIFGSTKSCTKIPLVINIVSLLCITASIVVLFI